MTTKELFFLSDNIDAEVRIRLSKGPALWRHAMSNWDQAIETIRDPRLQQLNRDAFRFAKHLQYNHIGLSASDYFCHPVRVAAYSIFLCENTEPEIGLLGLLHNALEVSSVRPDTLRQLFGEKVVRGVNILTINRDLANDFDYRRLYYQRIAKEPLATRAVKVLDKLDNVFLINQNPDPYVRRNYLREISEYVLPIARADFPGVANYMSRVVEHCRSLR
jgi:(p)ppGpp synthase/HD superfamily hydrolase